ncbi:hypothetical protein QQG74_18655 [Micromonospora sp. FIMYZ51]|uniref:hypothetical protein n=1 Tax=Micromonospora sp. FIMYZ51 TaxID=3051832 RepID=UPI00311E21A4
MTGSEQDEKHRTRKPSESAAPQVEVCALAADDEEGSAARPTWSAGARLLAAAAVLVLALGAGAVVVILSDPHRLGRVFTGQVEPPQPGGTATAAPGGTSGLGGAARAAAESLTEVESAPLNGRRYAEFELVDGVTRLRLGVADLGEELYRIGSPAGSGARPRPELAGDRLQLRMTQIEEVPGEVEVWLNIRVEWALRITGGSTERRLDLGAARLSALEFGGGATRTDLRLPPVGRGLVIRVTGGVNLFDVRVVGGVPVRVRANAGAGAVEVYDERRDGVPPGTVLGSRDWDRVTGRIFLDLVAGANIVTVRRG